MGYLSITKAFGYFIKASQALPKEVLQDPHAYTKELLLRQELLKSRCLMYIDQQCQNLQIKEPPIRDIPGELALVGAER